MSGRFSDFERKDKLGKQAATKRLTVMEVANRLGIDRTQVAALVDAGELPAIDVSLPGSARRSLRIRERDVIDFEIRRNAISLPARQGRCRAYVAKNL